MGLRVFILCGLRLFFYEYRTNLDYGCFGDIQPFASCSARLWAYYPCETSYLDVSHSKMSSSHSYLSVVTLSVESSDRVVLVAVDYLCGCTAWNGALVRLWTIVLRLFNPETTYVVSHMKFNSSLICRSGLLLQENWRGGKYRSEWAPSSQWRIQDLLREGANCYGARWN